MADNVIEFKGAGRRLQGKSDFSRDEEPRSPFEHETSWVNARRLEVAMAWLTEAEIQFVKVAPNQIKIGGLSFYAGGTFNLDGRRKERERGLTGLKRYLEAALGRQLPPLPETL